MNQQQFEAFMGLQAQHLEQQQEILQVLARGQAGVKLKPLGESTQQAWRDFRPRFELKCRASGWNAQQAKRNLQLMMEGPCITATKGVMGVEDANVDLAEFLRRMERAFVTPANSDKALQEWDSLAQGADETYRSYHARVREKFDMAFPGRDHAEEDRQLIRKFLHTLKDARVMDKASNRDADNWAQALETAEWAESKVAASRVYHDWLRVEKRKNGNGAGTSAGAGSNALSAIKSPPAKRSKAPATGETCFYCKKSGHRRSVCRSFMALSPAQQQKEIAKGRAAAAARRRTGINSIEGGQEPDGGDDYGVPDEEMDSGNDQ